MTGRHVIENRYPWCDDVLYDTVEEWSQAMRRSRWKAAGREWLKWTARIVTALVVLAWLWLITRVLAVHDIVFTVVGMVMVAVTLLFFVVAVIAWMVDGER